MSLSTFIIYCFSFGRELVNKNVREKNMTNWVSQHPIVLRTYLTALRDTLLYERSGWVDIWDVVWTIGLGCQNAFSLIACATLQELAPAKDFSLPGTFVPSLILPIPGVNFSLLMNSFVCSPIKLTKTLTKRVNDSQIIIVCWPSQVIIVRNLTRNLKVLGDRY